MVAQVADARIRATNGTSRQVGPDAYASAVMKSFLSILQLTPDQIYEAVVADNETPVHERTVTLEREALRSIADMIYRDPTGAFARSPEVKALRFPDYPASLKVQLAPMTEAQRLRKITDDLSMTSRGRPFAPWEIALAAEYGRDAVDAVDAKLKEMDAHRDRYNSGGYDALFHIIWAAQDTARANVWRRYRKDPDPGIRDSTVGGQPGIVPGY